MSGDDKAHYAPRVLAHFLMAVYGADALAEARRRAARQHAMEDTDIAHYWSLVRDEIAEHPPHASHTDNRIDLPK
jgi:hypothetical protein